MELDFSNDEAINLNECYWENISTETLDNSISAIGGYALRTCESLQGVLLAGEHNTEECIGDLIAKSEWISRFISDNADAFGKMSAGRDFISMTSDKQKSFKAIYDYWLAADTFKPISDDLNVLLMELSAGEKESPIYHAYRLILALGNMRLESYMNTVKSRITSDTKDIQEFIKKSNSNIDSLAGDELFEIDVKKGREVNKLGFLKNYISVLSRCPFYSSFSYIDERFVVNPDLMARIRTIDAYTKKISKLKSLNTEMGVIKEKAIKSSNDIKIFYTQTKIDAFKNMANYLGLLADKIIEIADKCEREIKNLGSDSSAPYCFMQKVGVAGFDSVDVDPWDDGTRYVQWYEQACNILRERCNQYVFSHKLEA